MNWEDYKVLSEKTLSTEFHCEKKDELLLHAVIGMLTEIEELLDNHNDIEADEINRGEEIGDFAWYVAIIAREYNLTLPEKVETSLDDIQVVLQIIKGSLKLLDFLKKKLYYNKPIKEDLFIQYSNEIISLFVAYASIHKIDLERGFDINIEKLRARYGEKFSSDKAINRNLEAERKILSKQ